MAMFHFRLKSDKKPDGTRISANQHLQYIQREGAFSNIDHSHENIATNKISASDHLDYINRNNEFAQPEGCIFQAHHLPKWANDNPKHFFQVADKYEGCGNRRYMEIEFALPNELTTVGQYRQIIDAFISKHLSDHYYAYAIHEKFGSLSDGQRHPHVHIMFSERLIDDVEKIKERSPKNFFKYPARKKKDGSEPTFDEKFNRGAPKARKWAEKSRDDFAHIQNAVLAKNGFSIRVDHRSLKAQKEKAELNGDSFLAKLFDRLPEEYIGIISPQDDDSPRVAQLKEFRALRMQISIPFYNSILWLKNCPNWRLKTLFNFLPLTLKNLLTRMSLRFKILIRLIYKLCALIFLPLLPKSLNGNALLFRNVTR